MDDLIEAIKDGDLAAAEIGIELIEEEGGFAFGRIIKSNAARALARCDLTRAQQERVRSRVIDMLWSCSVARTPSTGVPGLHPPIRPQRPPAVRSNRPTSNRDGSSEMATL